MRKGSPIEELEKGLKELKWFATSYEEKQYQPTRLPERKSSTKGNTWLQLHLKQRNALSGISGRRGPCSYEGSIDAPS